jgi:hypothetical protein
LLRGAYRQVIAAGAQVLQAVRRGKWKIPPPLP